jgi:hypothetical protein
MRPHLYVIADSDGLPHADVPVSCMWDLVESLSYLRTAVTYRYQPTHFTVTFAKLDPGAAQRVLDEWAEAPAGMLQSV